MNARDIVNTYFDIIENTNGEKLTEIVGDNATFEGPFFNAANKDEFITGMKKWIQLKKTYTTLKQFIDGNEVCSIQTIDIHIPTGGTVMLHIADWTEVRDGKIVKERVYFDPREYAKAMGL